jgi:hypothetical protein
MLVHRNLLNVDGFYAIRRSEIENLALEAEKRYLEFVPSSIIRVPVVVHVIYRDVSFNISEEQIQSQIDVLNRDYRMANSDLSAVPDPFKPLVADARIEFELATTDPNGDATSGITRMQTSLSEFDADNETIKAQATGGREPWPTNSYLNIWVCEHISSLAGPLLGYAHFPGCPPHLDGVVVQQSAFGTTGTVISPFNAGRTTTHEVGHWLNLYHLWGEDGNGCQVSDLVADTPNQLGPNYHLPSFPHVSCPDAAPEGDMFMNFMDYTDDACMCMFSAGQVARMGSTLHGPRRDLFK